MAYLNVSQVISELGLPTLLVRDLAQMPQRRRSTFRTLLSVQVLMAFVTWGGLVLLSLLLPYSRTTQVMLWLVGASLPLFAVSSAAQTLFQAGERMELVMAVEVLINTLILAFSIVVLWQGGGEVELVAVIIVTQLLSASTCLLLVWRSRLLAAPQERTPLHPLHLLRQTLPFFGLSMSDVLLQRLDILLLSFVGGPTVTGVYSAAYNVVRILIKLVQSFWKALYPTFSRLHRHHSAQYERLANLSLRYGLVALLPVAAIGMGTAPGLLHLIYGSDYVVSVRVFQILIWSAPLYLVESYAITVLTVEHHLRPSLWVNGLHLLAIVILLPPLAQINGANWGSMGSLWRLVLPAPAMGCGCCVSLHLPLAVKRLGATLGATLAAGAVTLLAAVGLVPGAVRWRCGLCEWLLGDRRALVCRHADPAQNHGGKTRSLICHTPLPSARISFYVHKEIWYLMQKQASDRPQTSIELADAPRHYRILMVAPTSFFADYGCHVRILEEARVLQRAGHQVTIVTYHNGRNLPDLDIRRTLPIPWRQTLRSGVEPAQDWLRRLVGLQDAATTPAQSVRCDPCPSPRRCADRPGIGCALSHPGGLRFPGQFDRRDDRPSLSAARWLGLSPCRALERQIDHRAPIIFTSSSNAERILIEQFGCDPARIQSLPDCVNTSEFQPASAFAPERLAELRRQFGVPPQARLIVYLGAAGRISGNGSAVGGHAKDSCAARRCIFAAHGFSRGGPLSSRW